jgi:anti-sigma-K factor RskA
MNLRDPDRADALAGEYVLGTLRGRARQRFERVARTERIVADAVRGWEERLLPLAEALSPNAPPSRVWAAILARIRSAPAPRARSLLGTPVGWWRSLALAGLATSLALAIALLKPAPPEDALVVVLAGQDAKPALVATSGRASRYLTVKAVAPLAVAPDRALELWMRLRRGKPRWLGLVSMVSPGAARRAARGSVALQNIPALATP